MTDVVLSSAAERIRRYRERRRRGLSCHFGRLRVWVHTNGISAVFCIRINYLLTLRTTRPTWSAR